MAIALRKSIAFILTLNLLAGLAGEVLAFNCGCAPAVENGANRVGNCCSVLPAADGEQLSALPCCSVRDTRQSPPADNTAVGNKDTRLTPALQVPVSGKSAYAGFTEDDLAIYANLPPPPLSSILLLHCSLLI